MVKYFTTLILYCIKRKVMFKIQPKKGVFRLGFDALLFPLNFKRNAYLILYETRLDL